MSAKVENETGALNGKNRNKVVEINFERMEKILNDKIKARHPLRVLTMILIFIVPILVLISLVFELHAESGQETVYLKDVNVPAVRFVSQALPKANFETANEFNWDSIKPTVSFQKDKLANIGFAGVGGQWFFDIRKQEEATSNTKPSCMTFSYGANKNEPNSLTFEEEIMYYTRCVVVIFTPVDMPIRNFSDFAPHNGRLVFVNTSMNTGGKDLENFMSLLDLQWIEVAEIALDMETINKVEASLGLLPRFGQLIFKFHRSQGMDEKLAEGILNVFDKALNNGFKIFHTITSCNGGGNCRSAYCFLNENYWGGLLADPEKAEEKKNLEEDADAK